MSLRDRIATPEGKAPFVRSLFATIADRYDLITVLLSYGQDRRWKRRLIDLAAPLRGRRVLDLACGTGDLAFAAAAQGGEVTGLDLTPRMIELARGKAPAAGVRFLVGDMMALPFRDASFDVVTTGYGLRNVPVLETTIAEIHRVLAPGGLLLSLDFNRPANATLRGRVPGLSVGRRQRRRAPSFMAIRTLTATSRSPSGTTRGPPAWSTACRRRGSRGSSGGRSSAG